MARWIGRLSAWILMTILLSISPSYGQAEENPDLQVLVDELRALAEKSRDQRAADRWLQQALEDLVAKYDWPWRRELLFDDFSDGDFSEDPAWTVVSGKFWIDASLGLRSGVEPPRQTRTGETPSERSRDSRRDLGSALVETLLDQAFERDEPAEERSRSREEASQKGPARIHLAAQITNAFSLQMEFSVHNEPGVEGHFEVALFQDQAGDYGYLLAIHTGRTGMMDLYRLRRGQRELVSSSRLETGLGNGERHELVWRQATNGQVEVFTDDKAVMNLRDNAFRDGYRWLELVNQSGELAVRQVKILGTPEEG